MSRTKWVIVGAAVLLMAAFVEYQYYEPYPPCRTGTKIPGHEYWRVAKTLGFINQKDKESVITGRYAEGPDFCFEISKAEADDPAGRLEGYKSALAYWVYHGEMREAKKLTGISFKSVEQMNLWLFNNGDLLTWSPEKDILVVDENARYLHQTRFATPREGDEISPVSYWEKVGRRELGDTLKVENGYRFVQTRNPQKDWITVRVKDALLSDARLKQEGFERAVRSLRSDLMNAKYQEDADDIIWKLGALTGLSGSREDWVRKLPGCKLALSPDGQSLTKVSE